MEKPNDQELQLLSINDSAKEFRKMMEAKRHIKRLMSVFDLSDCEGLQFPESASGRVMLFYDEEKNRKEFKLLNKTIPKNMRCRITSWLENHLDVCDFNSC